MESRCKIPSDDSIRFDLFINNCALYIGDDITQSRFRGNLFNTTWRDKYTN